MAEKFKIGYLPLSKFNWTNDTLEAARADAIRFLNTLPEVEVIAPAHMLALESEPVRREVMGNGWEHHYALMYGDRTEALTAFYRNLNIKMHLVK